MFLHAGFQEMEPNQVAYELFQPYHYNKSIPIALVSKHINHSQPYEIALRHVGFTNIRLISGHNGMEDFCFLMRTQYHLIGMRMSTYASWAGILSNATKVRLYAMDTNITRSHPLNLEFNIQHYQYHNQQLKQQMQFETYTESV
jgi:hypothetical protein